MNNLENNEEELAMCLSCIGTGGIYDSKKNSVEVCPYCNGTGTADESINECFLDTLNYN
jgi:DnaJ-class molecular chaperone